MSIVVTGLTAFASTTDGSSFATASLSPPANTLLVAAVLNTKASNADTPTSLTGCGLTWTLHTSLAFGTSDGWRLSVYTARGSAPSAGALTATFSATQTGCHVQVVAVSQAMPWVNALAETVLQSVSGSVLGDSQLVLTFTKPFGRSGALAFFGVSGDKALEPGSGWTELYEQALTVPNSQLTTQWRADPATTVSVTTTGEDVVDFGGLAFEVLALDLPVGAPTWPVMLHLFETINGPLIYTFPDPQGLKASDNERGFEALTGFQRMLPEEAFWLYDLAPGKWMVLTCGGLTVWEGRLEDRKLEPEGFSFTALGAKRSLDDAPYTALWSSKSYAGIKAVTAEEITKAAPERWAMDNNNRIWFGLVNGETYNNDDHYGLLVFRNPHRGEQKIKQLTYNYDYTLPTNWKLEIMGYDEGFASGAVEQTYTGDGANHTGSGTVSLSTSKDFLVFRVRNATGGNVTFASATGSSYAKLTSLRVKGTTSASLYADEVAKALVDFITNVNANQLADSYVGLQSPAKDLEDVVYEDMTPAAVLEDLIARGDSQTPPRKWEWGVWEGQRLYFQPQGTNAKTWYVEVDEDFTLDATLETLVNQAYALYQDANGRRLRTTVATDADSYNQYGLYRRGVAQAGQTTSQTTAQKSRDTLLNEQATIAPRAQLRLFGLYEAASGGPPLPLWLLRSGDTVTIRNLPPIVGSEIDRIRTFRVTQKMYDVEENSLALTPEFPLPGLEIQVANALSNSQGNVPGLSLAEEVVQPSVTPVFV